MSAAIPIQSVFKILVRAPRVGLVSQRYRSTRLYSSAVRDNNPKTLVKEKVTGKQPINSDHAPGWNEYLATESEAHVKADQSDVSVEKLTQKTIEHVHKRHHGDDKTAAAEAGYDRDEVEGPLRGKGKSQSSVHVPKHTEDAEVPSERDEVEGPLRGKGRPQLSRGQRKSASKDTTASEDAIRADRGEE